MKINFRSGVKFPRSAATVTARALKLSCKSMKTGKEFKPYFRTTDGDEIISRVYQEERFGVSVARRVVHASQYDKKRIEEDNWNWNRHSSAEKEATTRSFELMNDGFNLIIWISPKSDIYNEGRLNVMLPIKRNGEPAFDPWGIPLKLNEKESIELAERLLKIGGVSMDPIDGRESLRRQPIGFKLKNNENWLGKCRELIPEMRDVWEEIGAGGVEQNMEVIAQQVREAKVIAGGNNVLFEMVMAKKGFRLNVAGDHGGSWLSTLENKGIYNYEIEKIGGVYYTEKVKVNGKWVCPLCGKEIAEGETVCAKCGARVK